MQNDYTGVARPVGDELTAWRKLGPSPEAVAARLAAWENPQPLTLGDLRQMVGEPVWVEPMGEWRIVCFGMEGDIRLYSVYNTISARHVINNDGRIYRYPPKEVQL